MAEMARPSPNLDRLMNEGIAFVIDQFQYRIPDCPLGQRPVMIGRRKAAYNTVEKVMKRLDLIHDVMKAMNFIVIGHTLRLKSELVYSSVFFIGV